MPRVIVAEKPSVARDIAKALRLTRRRPGAIEGEEFIVTWAIGHLVRIAEPHEIQSAWKRWNARDLPILPDRWPLVVRDGTLEQYEVVKQLLTADDVSGVICATDAGREGELIFRYIYE
ncbi:MAG: toprim domain-containing protein, partial [Planctomycetota bacterium]